MAGCSRGSLGSDSIATADYGWRAIVRSDSGRFVRCIAGFKRRNLDPFMAEVIAAQEALSWVRSFHAKGIILEIDNRGL
ncbi:hypothetical protein J1N35_021301 [Gossypium stocksii]|uniref:RNase H type-1 domain-containing protein n=1 Tax=Gossypium stocksii TaxID=47602 RepID=A0A9D3VEC0_9ROSI|nr:hypothetical protein J1N35_021301 [Gossypium stocksii]